MRSLRLREGAKDARQFIGDGLRLMRGSLPETLALGLVLGVLPVALRAALFINTQGALLSLWEGWIGSLMTRSGSINGLGALIYTTMQRSGSSGLFGLLLDTAVSLIITPLLLSSLALLYNGFAKKQSGSSVFEAASIAGRSAKRLFIIALCCMLAGLFVKMVPSIASGLLSAVAGLLSFIPLLGGIANILALVLSALLSLLTDFAVTVVFCYVWIVASFEGVSGFGALVRSWQLTRNAMRETIYALLGLIILRWLAIAALGAVWLVVGRALSIPLDAYVLFCYLIGGLYTVALGATTSALYMKRPVSRGAYGGFAEGAPNIDHLKRANIDE